MAIFVFEDTYERARLFSCVWGQGVENSLFGWVNEPWWDVNPSVLWGVIQIVWCIGMSDRQPIVEFCLVKTEEQ